MGRIIRGFTDEAIDRIENDVFQVNDYIKGLGEFIKNCDTPMTISIQGDWGSGKTSMMNMIIESIKPDVNVVMFNTWQYSQFNMGDELCISFLSELLKQIESEDNSSKKLAQTLSALKWALKKGAVVAAELTAGMGELANNIVSAEGKQEVNLPNAVRELKEQFQKCVISANEKSGKDRYVFFVDDLDRLNPGKAVELLEVLKLFLDCKECVFVLAIDYSVVSQGVKEKYGNLIGEEKGKSFFDKIIQVPFKMPVSHYNVIQYVKNMIETIGIQYEEQELQQYVNLIQYSIGCNPRAMKRLFNAFSLLNMIYAEQMNENSWNKKVLFALLCMQQAYDELYNYLVANCSDIKDGDLLLDLAKADKYTSEDRGISIAKDMKISDELLITKMATFMRIFDELIDKDKNNELDDNEVEDFMRILGISTATSASTEVESFNDEGTDQRMTVRRYAKIVNEKLDKRKKLKIYQSRGDSDEIKRYYVYGYTYLKTPEGEEYSLEYAVKPDLEARTYCVETFIALRKRMSQERFKELFTDLAKASGDAYMLNAKQDKFVHQSESVDFDAGEKAIVNLAVAEFKNLLQTFNINL